MAAENCVVCLLGVMDHLWFHQTILFSEPSSMFFVLPEIPKTPLPTSHSPHCSSKNSSQTSLISDQEASLDGSVVTGLLEDESSSPESDHDKEETTEERQKRPNLSSRKNRAHSSSPTAAANKKQSRKILQKTMSCKSLWELELEEVKGFMDLGFVFEKDKLSKRIMNLIPGLQRIDAAYQKEENDDFELKKDDDFEGEVEEKIMRPYLSEAWIVKRPDSPPLLNLRVPRVSAAADMKKHLKYWARTVASAIHQES